MSNNDIQMDWRHFARTMAITFVVLFGLGVMFCLREIDGLQYFLLAMLSGLLSFFLAILISGMHAIRRDWRSGRLQPGDFVVPILVLVSILGGMAILICLVPASCQRYIGYIEIAFWLVVIGYGLRSWMLKRRLRVQIDPPDVARGRLWSGLLKK